MPTQNGLLPTIFRTCQVCQLVVSSPRSLRTHLENCLLQETRSDPDLRLPSDEHVSIIKPILTTYNSVHQSVVILQATGTCLPGLYPLFFPTASRSTPPILEQLGAVGCAAYQVLRRAVEEGPLHLPMRMIVEKGEKISNTQALMIIAIE